MKAKDIRKGTILIYNDTPYMVMDFQHRTPGNKRAFVQAKLRHVINGTQTEAHLSSTEDVQLADVYLFNGTYLYQDDFGFHFMNSETYEQLTLTPELVGDLRYFLQESMTVGISTYNDIPIGIKVPKAVTLTVVETDPELKGATATNVYKPAKTDTGLSLGVPPFIKTGEKIIVDTEEMKYLSRAD